MNKNELNDQENTGKECICPQPGEVALPGCPAHLVYIDEFDNYQIRKRTCDHTWMVTEWEAVYEYDVELGKKLELYRMTASVYRCSKCMKEYNSV